MLSIYGAFTRADSRANTRLRRVEFAAGWQNGLIAGEKKLEISPG